MRAITYNERDRLVPSQVIELIPMFTACAQWERSALRTLDTANLQRTVSDPSHCG